MFDFSFDGKVLLGAAVALLTAGAWWYVSSSRRRPGGAAARARALEGAVHRCLQLTREARRPLLPSEVVRALRPGPRALTVDEATLAALEDAAAAAGESNLVRHAVHGARSMAKVLDGLETLRQTSFEESGARGEGLLRSLWERAGLEGDFARPSEQWARIGFQGLDPTTDLRGGGLLALTHLEQLARTRPALLQEMMEFNRAVLEQQQHHWFLPAVVSIQLTVQLMLHEHTLQDAHIKLLYGREDARATGLMEGEEAELRASNEAEVAAAADAGGMAHLHQEMLHLFFDMWKEQKPHVMEYSIFFPKFTSRFFAPDWTPCL